LNAFVLPGWPPRFLLFGSLAAITAFGLVVMFKSPFVVGGRENRMFVLFH
jgi:hypothetical protein